MIRDSGRCFRDDALPRHAYFSLEACLSAIARNASARAIAELECDPFLAAHLSRAFVLTRQILQRALSVDVQKPALEGPLSFILKLYRSERKVKHRCTDLPLDVSELYED